VHALRQGTHASSVLACRQSQQNIITATQDDEDQLAAQPLYVNDPDAWNRYNARTNHDNAVVSAAETRESQCK